MSMKYLLLLVLFVCFSCTEPNVKDMLGDDFRLYKHTPAWSLACLDVALEASQNELSRG